MLSDKFRYVCLDFETTGLDTSKDEPIQIGIVEFDVEWKIIGEFQSLIKPIKSRDELKTIVGWMTGLTVEDLEDAPVVEDLQKDVLSFFDEKTIVIGHNIDFDLAFLAKYFPGAQHANKVDTYIRSQNFVHFAPSYALEVIFEYLVDKELDFQSLVANYEWLVTSGGGKYHDALYDSKLALVVFYYLVEYIWKLVVDYPQLKYFLQCEWTLFADIFDFGNFAKSVSYSFPTLERSLPGDVNLQDTETSLDIGTVTNKKRYFVGNVTFKETLRRLLWSKQVIFAFSHKQKLDMAKKTLQELWVKNIGFARWEQIINSKVFFLFLNKWNFSENEVYFVLKYVSHVYKKNGFLDLNMSHDYQIYYFLKEVKDPVKYSVVLTTHGGLFSLMKQPEHSYAGYDVVFFDTETWYRNYNNFLGHPFDGYYFLQLMETLLYVYQTRNQIKAKKYDQAVILLEELVQFFQIFLGTLFLETKQLFKNIDQDKIETNPILDNIIFHRSNGLLEQLDVFVLKLKGLLLPYDYEQFVQQYQQMNEILDTLVTIRKRMYQQSDFYFVYQETSKFTNWDEFLDVFADRQVIFVSDVADKYRLLFADGKLQLDTSEILPLYYENKLLPWLEEQIPNLDEDGCIFILSARKHESRALFDSLYSKKFHQEVQLIAENITWWVGKSVFKARQSGKKIVIGSYHFLLRLFSKWISIDKVVNFNIRGKQEKYLLTDLLWYGGFW